MSLADAKFVLNEVLDKQYADSLIKVYETRDSASSNTILLQLSEIKLLQQKCDNQKKEITDFTLILSNKDAEIKDLNDTIKHQKREIRKQKILKVIGFTAAVVLPITMLFLTHK